MLTTSWSASSARVTSRATTQRSVWANWWSTFRNAAECSRAVHKVQQFIRKQAPRSTFRGAILCPQGSGLRRLFPVPGPCFPRGHATRLQQRQKESPLKYYGPAPIPCRAQVMSPSAGPTMTKQQSHQQPRRSPMNNLITLDSCGNVRSPAGSEALSVYFVHTPNWPVQNLAAPLSKPGAAALVSASGAFRNGIPVSRSIRHPLPRVDRRSVVGIRAWNPPAEEKVGCSRIGL